MLAPDRGQKGDFQVAENKKQIKKNSQSDTEAHNKPEQKTGGAAERIEESADNNEIEQAEENDGYLSFREKYARRIDEESSTAAKRACARAVGILARLDGMLNVLAARYCVRPGDIDAIVRGVMTDPALSDGIAISGAANEANAADNITEYYRAAANDERYDEWQRDSQKIRQTLDPSFELDEQFGCDKEFARLLKSGVNACTAYYLRHKDEIDSAAAGKLGAAVSVRERQRSVRPVENGSSDIACASFGVDMKQLSKKAREEIRRKVKAGEKICL